MHSFLQLIIFYFHIFFEVLLYTVNAIFSSSRSKQDLCDENNIINITNNLYVEVFYTFFFEVLLYTVNVIFSSSRSKQVYVMFKS